MLGFILIPGLLYSEFFEMTFSLHQDYTQLLQELMQRLGFSSYRQLSRSAGVSEKQLRRLRSGQISQMRLETLLKLSQALQVSVSELLETFSPESIFPNSPADREEATMLLTDEASPTVEVLRQEYQRLQQQLEHQRESLIQEFQQSSLEVLESWLVQ